MARGINKVILIGHLGQDPEVRFAPSGTAIANMSLATSDSWTDKQSGQKQERTEWHRVVLFNKTAEIAQQYLRKGSKVYIEGRLQTRKWQDQNGQDKYSTEIVANDMQMLDSRGADQGQQGGYQQPQGAYQQPPQQPPQQQGGYQQQPQQAPQQPQGGYQQQPQQQAPQQPQGGQGQANYQQQHQQAPAQQSAPQGAPAQPGFDDFDDEIPFS